MVLARLSAIASAIAAYYTSVAAIPTDSATAGSNVQARREEQLRELATQDSGKPPYSSPYRQEGSQRRRNSQQARCTQNTPNLTAVKAVALGYRSDDLDRNWSAFQAQLLSNLPVQQEEHLRVLCVHAVPDSLEAVTRFETVLAKLTGSQMLDIVHFALFHYDASAVAWANRSWYSDPSGHIVIRHVGAGCLMNFWSRITPAVSRDYDYIWLLDGDMDLSYFSWPIYRSVLLQLDPLISQPAVLPRIPGGRSTDIPVLRMRTPSADGDFHVAFSSPRSEVMTPVISQKLWPVIHERLLGNDLTSTWLLDYFWDTISLLTMSRCNCSGIVVVNGSPVRHLDTRSLSTKDRHRKLSVARSVHCSSVIREWDSSSSNRRITPHGRHLLQLGFASTCGSSRSSLPFTSNETVLDVWRSLKPFRADRANFKNWTACDLGS